MENLEVDGCKTATFCTADENDVDMSPVVTAALPSHCDGKTTKDVLETPVSRHHGTSATSNNLELSAGEIASTSMTALCSATKLEPGIEEEYNWAPRQDSSKRSGEVVTASVHEQQVRDVRCVHFTASSPSLSFSHRCDCLCGPLPSIASSSDNTRRRRRRPGLSRLRRTELRRRSRTVTDLTDDPADDLDGTASVAANGLGLDDVDLTASSNVISDEPRAVTGGQNRAVNSTLNSTGCDAAVKPNNTDTVAQSSTSEMKLTASVTLTVDSLTTTLTPARQSPENRRPPDNQSNKTVTVGVNCDRHVTNRSTLAETKRPLIRTHPADCSSTSSISSFDISRTSTAVKASPLSLRRTLDRDIVSLCNVVNTPLRVPSTPLLQRIRTQCIVADGSRGGYSSVVAVPRCYASSTVKWRHCYGELEKQSDIVTLMQTRGVTMAAPVLRYALTALKCNTVALVNSPACYIPRHMPIVYPSYRLLCYPPSPCV